MAENALAVRDNSAAVMPVVDVATMAERYKRIVEIKDAIMTEDVDYGVIPGTVKPTLLKPGAEKLCTFFGLVPEFEPLNEVIEWNADEPFFFFRYRCTLRSRDGTYTVGSGIGSCNSREKKYRYRWIAGHEVPPDMNTDDLPSSITKVEEFTFAVDKAETTGKYGKPESYWQKFRDAIEDGTAEKFMKSASGGRQFEAYRISDTVYRIPNPDIADTVNTIDKMAQKRALIAATLVAVGASDFFTQDVEDMPEFGGNGIVDGEVVDESQEKPKPKPREKTATVEEVPNEEVAAKLKEARKEEIAKRDGNGETFSIDGSKKLADFSNDDWNYFWRVFPDIRTATDHRKHLVNAAVKHVGADWQKSDMTLKEFETLMRNRKDEEVEVAA